MSEAVRDRSGDLPVVRYQPTPDQFSWTFGGCPPVARLRPGDVVELWTEDCYGGNVRAATDLVSRVCEFPFLNPQTGPFYVEGAQPGDTLALHFVSIEPSRDYAASTTVPLFGALTSTHETATLQDPLPEVVWMYELDRARRTATYRPRSGGREVVMPLDPMHGTVGVAPAGMEARSAIVPGSHGGNMDTPEVRAGVTVYFGVNVEGALFALGDGHGRQGEGESCGTALESAMDTVVVVDLIAGTPTPWPRIESDTHIMTVGSAKPLEDAFRVAHVDLVAQVGSRCGLDRLDAYQLVSQLALTPIANVCNPTYSVVAKIAKEYLPSDHDPYRGTHVRFREQAAAYRAEHTPFSTTGGS
ncbi:acetamidase/formamidase family protein [Qaidamihabitans albus]|uniref:acetamidase/formamidase family protein n=1 Tax=Qaidamihabitans albus TaxID=2795733 RepID=UPI0018F1EA58|nr:acetamidase/formamidase family protein [Qaidamihabitans albus]